MKYYYDENKKANCLDCHYPEIDEKAIEEIVKNSLARYIYINIYDEKNKLVTFWSYEVKHGGFHLNEDPKVVTAERIKNHTARIKRYIQKSYNDYVVNANVLTPEKVRRSLLNDFNLNFEFVASLSDAEALRIFNKGVDEYNAELYDQELEAESLYYSEDDKMLSVSEYAKKHGVDTSTVRHKISRGLLPATKIGKMWFIKESEPWTDNRCKK